MKKLVLAMAAAFLVFAAAAGSASAASFANGDLVLVLYEEGGNEVAIDLGEIADYTVNYANYADNFDDISNVKVGLFSVGTLADCFAGNSFYYGSADSDNAPELTMSAFMSSVGLATDTYTSYAGDTTDGVTVISETATGAYYTYLTLGGTSPGAYGGISLTGKEATFDDDGNSIIYLYGYTAGPSGITVANDGNYVAAISISSVPVPGTLVLLGSGILGLVGLRRKNS